ncbi:MAG: hypothetical protein ACR2IF_10140 [Terriglobales bacterium]
MQTTRSITLVAVLIVALASSFAFADDVTYTDPATLQIGATVPPAGSDPNVLTGTSFFVYQNQGNTADLHNPWLVIVGLPNTNTVNPFGSGITSIVPSAGGPTSWSYLGLQGTMHSGQEAYSVLGVHGPTDNSNSFTNWSGVEASQAGITASSFGLYEFSVNANLGGKDNVGFNLNVLPKGAMIIAYGQVITTTHTTTCKKGKCTTSTSTDVQVFDTPFTQAGFENPPRTAEPASMIMLAVGLAGAGLFGRKVRK